MNDAWALIVAILNEPDVRAITVLLSALSLLFSIWAFRKTSAAANRFVRHVGAEHARRLEDRWVETYRMTLSSPEFARVTSSLFGDGDTEATRRDAVLLTYLNIMLSSFMAMKAKVISADEHRSHLTSFFSNVRGEREALLRLLDLPGYEKEFRDDCRQLLFAVEPVHTAASEAGATSP